MKSSPGVSTRSLISARYAFRPGDGRARRGCARDVAIGGIAAPLPSKTTTSGSSDAASRAPSSTFDANGAPAMPPPARRQPMVGTPRERRGLEMVGRGVAARTRESATRSSTVGGVSTSSGSGGAAPPHRDDDDAPVAREQPRDVPGDGRLADALAGADHGERRQLERVERRRVEAEVGADVRQAEREEARREREPQLRRQHRLVGEVDDDLASPGSSTIGTP